MPRLILIETSTSLCSTALVDGDSIVCSRRSDQPRAHAAMTAVFVKEMLDEAGWKAADCDAVAVSAGPGSYTGLRVGSSTAKGLCFGANIPLISVGTLDTLVWQYLDSISVDDEPTASQDLFLNTGVQKPNPVFASQRPRANDIKYIIPVIDARRMEVYTAVYNTEGQRLTDISPIIVDENFFAEYRSEGPVVFIGDGAAKIAPVLGLDGNFSCRAAGASDAMLRRHPEDAQSPKGDRPLEGGRGVERLSSGQQLFINCCPEANGMLKPAIARFKASLFEDTAYFEPFYLKQFVATVGKKLF